MCERKYCQLLKQFGENKCNLWLLSITSNNSKTLMLIMTTLK